MVHGRMFLILGDVHGEFGMLNGFINRLVRQNDMFRGMAETYREAGDDFQVIILQCGDFAYYWPLENSRNRIKNQVDWLPGGYVPVYWTGGNHEDWDELDRLGPGVSEVDRGVFYCPFGSTLDVKPDLTLLFAGGAESHDTAERLAEMKKGSRKIWWEQEGISEKDMERLALVPKADWVVSHSAPAVFDFSWALDEFLVSREQFFAPSREKLDRVFEKYHPKRWYFGHFHHHLRGELDGCTWECLAPMGCGDKFWDKAWLEWED